jgi:anti-sigma B factor antagonist
MAEKDLQITDVAGANPGEPVLVIDMTAVPYIDSAGIGALVGVQVNRQKDGRTLLLVGVTDRVRTALQVTKVESLFTFAEATGA